MPKTKEPQKAETQEEEIEIRETNDYENGVEEYDDKKKKVTLAVDMTQTSFWKYGFRLRRELFNTTHAKLTEVVEEKSAEDYDSVENMKQLNKAKLDFTKAVTDFDNYVSDVELAVAKLAAFCDREHFELFNDITLMSASFSRKTGTIAMFTI